jgi:hypothetical protein
MADYVLGDEIPKSLFMLVLKTRLAYEFPDERPEEQEDRLEVLWEGMVATGCVPRDPLDLNELGDMAVDAARVKMGRMSREDYLVKWDPLGASQTYLN